MIQSEDEIELRPYVLAVLRRWWLITIIAVVAISVAYFFSSRVPDSYQAASSILIARSRPQLSLAAQFPTISDPQDRRYYIDTVLSIAKSDQVAQNTLDSLQQNTPDENLSIDGLKEQVDVTAQGNLVLITVTARSSEIAEQVANTWARDAVQTINLAFSEEQPLLEIQDQLSKAEMEYETSQAALENYIKNSKISLLDKQLNQAENMLDAISSERNWRTTYYVNRKEEMMSLIVQARALKEQIEAGSLSTASQIGDVLAVVKARAEAFGIAQGGYRGINIPSESSTSDGMGTNYFSFVQPPSIDYSFDITQFASIPADIQQTVEDMDTLIIQAEKELDRADEELRNLSAETSSSSGDQRLIEASALVQSLRSELEEVKAEQLKLSTLRDTSWNAYQAISQKESELRNGSSSGNYVNIASLAVGSKEPVPGSTLKNMIIAGVLGAFLAIVWALVEYWLRVNILTQKPILSKANE